MLHHDMHMMHIFGIFSAAVRIIIELPLAYNWATVSMISRKDIWGGTQYSGVRSLSWQCAVYQCIVQICLVCFGYPDTYSIFGY